MKTYSLKLQRKHIILFTDGQSSTSNEDRNRRGKEGNNTLHCCNGSRCG